MKRRRGQKVEEESRSQSRGSNSEGIRRNRKRRKDDRLLAYLIGCEEKIPIWPIVEAHLKGCLDCIQPSALEHQWCCDEIGEMVTFLRFANDCPDALRFSRSRAARTELREMATICARSAALLRGTMWRPNIFPLTPPFVLRDMDRRRDEICDYLETTASLANQEIRDFKAQRAPSEPVKYFAAMFAFALIKFFSIRAPTLTTDGPFFRLATYIYEAATAIPDQNLERQCRREFHKQRDMPALAERIAAWEAGA